MTISSQWMASRKTAVFFGALLAVCSISTSPCLADNPYLNRFTYEDQTIDRGDGFKDYAPQDWQDIECDEKNDLDECIAYPDKWKTGRDWKIEANTCRWCPDDGTQSCGRHHQSPINLLRQVGLDLDQYPNLAHECIDLHWMKYEDSTCTFERLIDTDAFTIERHGLRVTQPIIIEPSLPNETVGMATDGLVVGVRDTVRLDCVVSQRGCKFGRLDYSKGFHKWWYLSHMDFKVPSEHTQDGIRYDAEIQIQHFYSDITNGNENEMGTVAIFMKAYDDAPPYRYLDKVICQWRRKEHELRQQCGIEPIDFGYPGCFPLHKGRRRNLKQRTTEKPHHSKKRFQTMFDVIHHNDLHQHDPNHTKIAMLLDESNFEPDEDKDWDAWIEEQSRQMRKEDELYLQMKRMQNKSGGSNDTDAFDVYLDGRTHRKLSVDYNDVPWFNYWPMLGVRTEYYFRYQGTQTIPPCYGKETRASRRGVNHWRVLKDPIRIHPRQLKELKRLISQRVAPPDDPVAPCQFDTAAKVDSNGDVSVARPLQSYYEQAHFETFCECKDWVSKWPEDRQWCKIQSTYERLFDKPYNWNAV